MVDAMNRREFVVRSSLLVSAGWLVPSRLWAAAGAAAVTEFRALRRNVGVFTGRGGAIGWLSNQDGLAVVDTQFPDTAAACLAGLPERGDRMIDVVINSHHHGDHTGGNAVFKPSAKTIVAHANVPKLQMAAAERAGTVERQVFADATFVEAWRKDIGDETVTAQYLGPAHTSGDIIVHFEKANVVHMGDLMFNRLYPVIDRPAGASIRHWITVLEDAVKTFGADAVYIFGHGNAKFGVTGGVEDIRAFRDYLSGLLEHVQKEIAAGKAKNEIVGLENLPGFEEFHAPLPNRLGSNLGVAFDELTEKAG